MKGVAAWEGRPNAEIGPSSAHEKEGENGFEERKGDEMNEAEEASTVAFFL